MQCYSFRVIVQTCHYVERYFQTWTLIPDLSSVSRIHFHLHKKGGLLLAPFPY